MSSDSVTARMASRRDEPPTVIVFTREPVPGKSKTRLARRIGANRAAALADAFIRDAIAKVKQLDLPIVIAASTTGELSKNRYFRVLARRSRAVLVPQHGGNLGERMANSLASYLDAGVVLIGTDTPSLPPALLRRGVALLRRHRVVLGPTLDGGYYLVGVRGTIPDMFRGIGWGGPRVLEQTLGRLERAGIHPGLAPSWYDVDRWSDLVMLTEHLRIQARRGQLPCRHTSSALRRLGLLNLRRLH